MRFSAGHYSIAASPPIYCTGKRLPTADFAFLIEWQNLSIPISENVRVGKQGAVDEVTIGGRMLKQQELTRKDI